MSSPLAGSNRKVPRRFISGVMLLNKPLGLSSNTAMMMARRLLSAEKAGHGGTLDPLATGLLPVLFGEATKFSQDLLDADKQYSASIRLGVTTTTGDREGAPLQERPIKCSLAEILNVLARFRGSIEQIPPMYSALKRDGKPLYEYARKGEVVAREPRRVVIHALELLSYDGLDLKLSVDCSKGTYIRTLAEDIGEALGCGAHLGGLCRTRVGRFSLHDAVTTEQIEGTEESIRESFLMPVDSLLESLPAVYLSEIHVERFSHGGVIMLGLGSDEGLCRAYGPSGDFLGLASLANSGELTPKRLLRTSH